MTMRRGGALRDRNVTARRANHSRARKPVQSPRKKYFAFSESQISRSVHAVPLLQRGVSRTSRTWGGMRWTQWRRKTGGADADGKIVWSWRPDAGAKFLRSKLLRSDGGKRARSPGRSRISRKTIAQGRPDVSGEPVVSNSCAFYFAHEAAGALGTRSSLRPLISFGRHCLAKLGRIVPRERGGVSFQLFENRIGNGAHTPSTSSWRRPGPIRRVAHVGRCWSTAFAATKAWGYGSWPSPGRHRLCCYRIRRVGKGALAPCHHPSAISF
jgi:hypothetical protein